MNLLSKAEQLSISAATIRQQAEKATAACSINLKNAAGFAQQSAERTQQHLSTAIGAGISEWQSEIAALGTSGMIVANALKDLPRTAQALAEEMPKLARRLQTAGTRLGDAPRADADIL